MTYVKLNVLESFKQMYKSYNFFFFTLAKVPIEETSNV